MKFYNLKYFFLFLILLIISQSVFCQEADTDGPEEKIPTTADNTHDQQTITSSHSVTTTVNDNIVPIETTSVKYVQTTTTTTISTTTISITRTTDRETTTTTRRSTTTSSVKHDDDHNGSTSNNGNNGSNYNNDSNYNNGSNSGFVPTQPPPQSQPQSQPQPQPTEITQLQQDQSGVNANQSINNPTSTNTTIGTIDDGKAVNDKKKDGGVPTWCIILGLILVGAILIATVGFVMTVQKKKKNNDQLSPNLWTVPDDFDSRVITPIAPPANTYNMNNAPMTQPMYQQATYGQAPVMTEGYNQVQSPAYADSKDIQLPTTTGAAVPVDNSYSNDYPNGNSNEYIPTSIEELKVNNVYTSQFTFQPELDDEIEINIDDQIYIEEIFADNWALGVNTTNNARGCFPLNIFLNPKSTLDNSRSQRTLSYCSTGNGPSY